MMVTATEGGGELCASGKWRKLFKGQVVKVKAAKPGANWRTEGDLHKVDKVVTIKDRDVIRGGEGDETRLADGGPVLWVSQLGYKDITTLVGKVRDTDNDMALIVIDSTTRACIRVPSEDRTGAAACIGELDAFGCLFVGKLSVAGSKLTACMLLTTGICIEARLEELLSREHTEVAELNHLLTADVFCEDLLEHSGLVLFGQELVECDILHTQTDLTVPTVWGTILCKVEVARREVQQTVLHNDVIVLTHIVTCEHNSCKCTVQCTPE